MSSNRLYRIGDEFQHREPNMFWRKVTITDYEKISKKAGNTYVVKCMPLEGLAGSEVEMTMYEKQISKFLKPFKNAGKEDTSVF